MTTKKKQVEKTIEDAILADLNREIGKAYEASLPRNNAQQILEHFGENSAEYSEAKAKAEKE